MEVSYVRTSVESCMEEASAVSSETMSPVPVAYRSLRRPSCNSTSLVRIWEQQKNAVYWKWSSAVCTLTNCFLWKASNFLSFDEDVVVVPIQNDLVLSIEATGQSIAVKLLQPDIAAVPGISLLLGADHLWKVTTGKLHRHPRNSRLVALISVFG